MTTVGESAFNGCTRLSQIDLENVETIGSQAFRATSSLSVVLYMPKLQSMTGINNFYQSGITGISSLGHISSIPAGAGGTNGNVGAFSNCTALVNVVLPEEMTSVSMYTFNGCTHLSSISGLEHITSYGSRCFNKAPICADASVLSNAEIIGAMAFSQAEFYGELSCPNLTEIGHKAFSNNTLLSKVTNLGSITTIVGGNGTNDAMGPFIQCELQELVIPSTVSSIGQNAVTFDVAGATLICNPDTPPTLNASAFQNTGNLTIYVPDASVDAYKAASVWSNYAGVIQGISSYNP